MSEPTMQEAFSRLAIAQAETQRELQRTQVEVQKAAQSVREVSLSQKEQNRARDQQIKELGIQIGGLGEKFGSFTEGMAFPSMRQILEQRFHADVIGTRMIGRNIDSNNGGHRMELDVIAYANRGLDEVYVVEVKSHLREDGLQRMIRNLKDFHKFFPGHQGKKVYGILAYVDAPKDVCRRALEAGLYLARIHDGLFEIEVPDDFQPWAF
jgi:hypothetical protein